MSTEPLIIPLTKLKPDPDNSTELIKHRFLCAGGSVVLAGYAGLGKSSLLIQLAMHWAVNRPCLGFEPTRKLSSLIIQAENDDEDVMEMRDGCLEGMDMSMGAWEKEAAPVNICCVYDKVGASFANFLRAAVSKHKPDIAWIDPALSFIGGDTKEAADVGRFLRNLLHPIQRDHKCAIFINTHMNKPPMNRELTQLDLLYAATGSIEWTNWARATLVLKPLDDYFTLDAVKRGDRLKWTDPEGTLVKTKCIEHAPDGTIWWRLKDDIGEAGRPKEHDPAQIVNLLPPNGSGFSHKEWMEAALRINVSESTFHRFLRLATKNHIVSKNGTRYHRNLQPLS